MKRRSQKALANSEDEVLLGLGLWGVRQEKEATAIRTADDFGKDLLLGRDEDATAERVVIITDSPRQGRHIHHVLETKVVTKKR